MADISQKLMLHKNVQNISLGSDDTDFQRMAFGRRKSHFAEMHDDDIIERLAGRSVSSSGEEEVPVLFTEGNTDGTNGTSSNGPRQGNVNGADTLEESEKTRSISISDYDNDVFFSNASDASEIEKTCVVAFATVNNIRETTGETVKQQMRDYLVEVFNLPKSRLQVLTEMADLVENPELKLTCKVLHARSLTAKDANGKSDPYCQVGIIHQKYLEKNVVKTKDLVNWEKEGMMSSDIHRTSIKLATLDPDWNEELELTVTEPAEEILVLEIWDSDDDEIQQQNKSKIKGLKGLGNYLTDLRKGVDDFMGRCFYPLKSIPVSGEVKTFVLHSHSTKTKHGFISLSLDIRGVKENTPVEVSVWEHTMLTRALVNESSRSAGCYVHRWDGKLHKEGEKLLEQHALLNGLNKLQLAAIRLSVLTKYHKLYAVQVSTMKDLLHSIKESKTLLPKSLTPEDLKKKANDSDKSNDWLVQMFTDLLELATDIEEIFNSHLGIFNINTEQGLQKLEDNLIILRELFSFRPFTFQLPPEKRNLKDVLESCIREATRTWFSVTEAKLLPAYKTPTSDLEAFKELSERCLHLSNVILKKLGPMFMEEGVSYFSQFYVTMDNLLCANAKAELKSVTISAETSPITFEIHMNFRKLCKLAQYCDKDMVVDLALCSSHTFFNHLVKGWISLAINRCHDRIKKAIELNEIVKGKISISTSAIDTCGFLMQVGEFWGHLDWPDPSVAYGLMITMLQQMCDCTQFYVRELHSAYESCDHSKEFYTTEELSVALNNVHHIRTVVRQFPEKLNLENFYSRLDQGTSEDVLLGTSAKQVVTRLLSSTDDDFGNKIRQFVEDISQKLSPDILKYMDKLISAPSTVSDLDAIAPLLNYLAVNLQTLGDHTFSEVFCLVLIPIWKVCVEAVDKSLKDFKSKKGANLSLLSQRLTATWDLLKEFFHADGHGLDTAEMETSMHSTEVFTDLKLLGMNSDELTLQFFLELVELQRMKASSDVKDLGELLVSVMYDKTKACLDVHVIQGRGLPSMDKDGLSDPYVQLTLLPQWKYVESSKKTFKTQVEKNTLEPYFDREFQIPAAESDMNTEGGILLLTVLDYDIITSDDFTGMCVVPLNRVPGLTYSADPAPPSERNLTLPLFVIEEESQVKALVGLRTRSKNGDSRATSFFKVNKKILGNPKVNLFKEGSKTSLFSF